MPRKQLIKHKAKNGAKMKENTKAVGTQVVFKKQFINWLIDWK